MPNFPQKIYIYNSKFSKIIKRAMKICENKPPQPQPLSSTTKKIKKINIKTLEALDNFFSLKSKYLGSMLNISSTVREWDTL